MSIIPMLTARAVIKKLMKAGFRFLYARGSHYIFRNQTTNRITSVPMHAGKDIGRNLLGKIIKQAGISLKEFLEL